MSPPTDGPRAALAGARQAQHDQWAAEARQLECVLEFTRHYRALSTVPDGPALAGTEQLIDFGSDGTPRLAEFCVLELAAALAMPEESAFILIGDVLDLAYRHPQLWQQVRECQLRVWIARRLVSATRTLPLDAALLVDEQLAAVAVGMSPRRLFRLAEGLVLQASDPDVVAAERERALARRGVWFDQSKNGITGMGATLNAADAVFLDAQIDRVARILASGGDDSPTQVLRAKALGVLASPARALQFLQASLLDDGLPALVDAECPAAGQRGHTCGQVSVDPDKLLPRSQLVIHLTDRTVSTGAGVGRAENLGPVLAGWVKDLTANTRIHVRPVLKVDALLPSDAYEVPDAMREALTLRNPVSVFPYASRASARVDLDHTEPFSHDGTPAQTRTSNLGPLARRQHRAKTFAGWQLSQPWPGVFCWTSPLGYNYLVTPSHNWLVHEPDQQLLLAAAC